MLHDFVDPVWMGDRETGGESMMTLAQWFEEKGIEKGGFSRDVLYSVQIAGQSRLSACCD